MKLLLILLGTVLSVQASTIKYNYDNRDRLASVEYKNGLVLNYGYDKAHNLTEFNAEGAYGNIYLVSLNSTPAYPYALPETAANDIETVLKIVKDNDVILVYDGTYSHPEQLSITKEILLTSLYGADNTIIDGQGLHRCIYINNNLAIVKGFTIQNGHVEGLEKNGAGVWIQSGGTVQESIILDNNAEAYAGGVFLADGGKLSRCILRNNSAYYGGGAYCKSGGYVENCVMENNIAKGNGGGIYCESDGLILNITALNNSTVYGDGGGVYLFQGGTIRNGLVHKNTAARNGGGVACAVGGTIENTIVENNTAGQNNDNIYIWNGN